MITGDIILNYINFPLKFYLPDRLQGVFPQLKSGWGCDRGTQHTHIFFQYKYIF